jgi:riboflavin biosynthesis pyrimidine reductase
MRLLLADGYPQSPGDPLDEDALAELYAPPGRPWLRVNFVSTLDGAANGSDGRSGTINTEADGIVFHLLRRLSDVVVIGAGTARIENYGRLREQDGGAPPLAVVSHQGRMPERLLREDAGHGRGPALLITRNGADPENLARARESLGEDGVLVCGEETVDLKAAVAALAERGLTRMLSEGGPTLMDGLLAAGCVDELDLTWSPTMIGGSHPRIVAGTALDIDLEPMVLVESQGSVMGRWRVLR